MTGHGWMYLEIALNGWKWLEMARNGWHGWRWLDMAGNCLTWFKYGLPFYSFGIWGVWDMKIGGLGDFQLGPAQPGLMSWSCFQVFFIQ